MIGMVPRDCWEYSWRDVIRGLVAAFYSRKDNELLSIAGIGACIPVRSGRAAILAALNALSLPPGSSVAVPLYCCPVVFRAITEAGCKARFIDIDPKTFCISANDLYAKRSEIDAIIAVHMFGNLCDMPAIVAASEGRPIIEDCALSLGSKLAGRMAGSYGTMSIFSFRSGKYLSAGEGGALFTKHPDIRSRASRFIEGLPVPSLKNELTHVLVTYIKSGLRRKPLYGVAGYRLWNFANKKFNLSANSGIALSKAYRSDIAIIKSRLDLIDSEIAVQREHADYYSRTLSIEPNILYLERPNTFYNRYQYPITFQTNEQRDWMATYLLSRQIDTTKYIEMVPHIAAEHYGYEGDCPVSESLIQKTMIIPSYHRLHRREVERIAKILNSGWMELMGRAHGSDNSVRELKLKNRTAE